MKSIIYIVPYFGKMPKNFQLWLKSCEKNESINWIIITDDKTKYKYPTNVKVVYDSFENLRLRIQKHYDFKICLDRPWKVCEFRPAFGEIFEKEINGFDFWGYCDIDLIFGNIRKFITEDILNKYDKIGFQGHSTIYRNTKEVNERYKFEKEGLVTFREAFSNSKGYCFDEGGISKIYEALNIQYYNKVNFAHLCKYDYGFYLEHLPKEEDYKNKYQILTWENGNVYRYYIENKKIYKDEFMYIHFFCRPMSYKIKEYKEGTKYVFYPDVAKEINEKDITIGYIKRKSKHSRIRYYIKSIWYNRKKLTFNKIKGNIQRMIKYKKTK